MSFIIKRLINQLVEFRNERNWIQFHTPKNLACSISIEAAELLQLFQWQDENNVTAIKYEMADILIYLLYLSHDLDIDLLQAVKEKIEINEKHYPIKESKGNARKHTEFVRR